MEIIGYIILLVLVYCLFVYVVLPVATIGFRVLVVIASIVAFVVSLKCFLAALIGNRNPYDTYDDYHHNGFYPQNTRERRGSDASQNRGSRRNYFFGPGIHQIKSVVRDSIGNLSDFVRNLRLWKDRLAVHHWAINFWIKLAYYLTACMAIVLGGIWMIAFCVVLTSIILVGFLCFFAFFTCLSLIDRCVLAAKSIHSRCSYCKNMTVIPVFVCPACEEKYDKLVPGPYGVFHRRCECGKKLSTTFLGGRSHYVALCPKCGRELYSSGSKQCGYQLVGGIGNGKTAYLTAFCHEYREWLEKNRIDYQLLPEQAFERLEQWFCRGTDATSDDNAVMYSIMHLLGKRNSVQMTIYDIAGEVFLYSAPEIQQKQMMYCEGFLITLDPTEDDFKASEFVVNFLNYFKGLKGKVSIKMTSVPVAVLITKADLFKREIGIPKIKAAFGAKDVRTDSDGFLKFQSDICRSFLLNHEFGNTVNLIESEFTDLRYFPVSSMGHSDNEEAFEPWGVLQPFFWLTHRPKCPLCEMFDE